MAYSDFFSREDVYGIIIKTLEEHFSCQVIRKLQIYKEWDKGTIFYCFKKIGYIVPISMPKKAIEYIFHDYHITRPIWKKIVVSIYLKLLVKSPRFLSDGYLYIEDSSLAGELLIQPGNKKIRILDFENSQITCYRKQSFKKTWLEKEIVYREFNTLQHVIPVKRMHDGYVEPLIIGYSYVRLSQFRKAQLAGQMGSIWNSLGVDIKRKNAKWYADELFLKIRNSVMKSKLSKMVDNDAYSHFFAFINLIPTLIDEHLELSVGFSHGDMQPGNLLWEQKTDKLYLIDWETWSVRSIYYDRYLFYYGFRNSTKLLSNMAAAINELSIKLFGYSLDKVECISSIIIFILEDIFWQLEELTALPDGSLPNGLRFYLEHLNQREVMKLLSLSNKNRL